MNTQTANSQTAERPAPAMPEFRINNRAWTQQEVDKFEASQAEKRAKRAAKACTQ